MSGDARDIDIGFTAQFHAVARDGDGNSIALGQFTWSSSDTTRATVSPSGVVTGRTAGSVAIRATAGGVSGTAPLTVRNARHASLTVDDDVSVLIQERVHRVYSAFGSGPLSDSTLRVPAEMSGALVFALDAEGAPLLAGFSRADGVHIGVESTALVIARFALSPLRVEGFSQEDVYGALGAAPAFGVLLSDVRDMLESGGVPTQSDEIADRAAEVAEEARNALAEAGPSAAAFSVQAASTGRRYFIQSVWFGESLWLEDVTGPGVSIFNETRLDWDVRSRNTEGETLARETAEWLPYTFWSIIPWHSTPTITALLGNNSRFTVTVEQTAATRGKHAVHFFTSFSLALLEATGLARSEQHVQCAATIANTLLNEKFPALVTQADRAAAQAYIAAVFPTLNEDPTFFYRVIGGCGVPLPELADLVAIVSQTVASYWRQAQRLNSLAGSLEFGYQMMNYWNASYETTVCKHEGRFAECVERVNIVPDSIVMGVSFDGMSGGYRSVAIEVDGPDGVDLSSSPDVVWTSSDTTIVTVGRTNAGTGALRSRNRVGRVQIRATIGGVSDSALVVVVPLPEIPGTFDLISYRTLPVGTVLDTDHPHSSTATLPSYWHSTPVRIEDSEWRVYDRWGNHGFWSRYNSWQILATCLSTGLPTSLGGEGGGLGLFGEHGGGRQISIGEVLPGWVFITSRNVQGYYNTRSYHMRSFDGDTIFMGNLTNPHSTWVRRR